jgi:hypothetical protein
MGRQGPVSRKLKRRSGLTHQAGKGSVGRAEFEQARALKRQKCDVGHGFREMICTAIDFTVGCRQS